MRIYTKQIIGDLSCDPVNNGELNTCRWLVASKNVRRLVDVGVGSASTLIDCLGEDAAKCEFDLVEAVPKFAGELRSKYGHLRNVRVHEFAACDVTGDDKLYCQSGSLYNRACLPGGPQVDVKKTRLDDLIVAPIDFLKVDVEGSELITLRGAEALLKDARYVQFEYGGTYPDAKITLRDVVELLRSHRFANFYNIERDGLNLDATFTEDGKYRNYLATRETL